MTALQQGVRALAEDLRRRNTDWLATGRGLPAYSGPWVADQLERLLASPDDVSEPAPACRDDHAAWREEIAELKSDVEMWKALAQTHASRVVEIRNQLTADETLRAGALGDCSLAEPCDTCLSATRRILAAVRVHLSGTTR